MKPPTNPLSEQLRDLRMQANLSGREAAKLSGLSPAKISRVETGAFMPTPPQVDKLCRVYQAPDDVRRHLVELIEDLRETSHSARVVLQRGGWQMQERIGRIEAAAKLVRSFSPDTMIGLLQTEPYIRALMGDALQGENLERTVRARLDRQTVLDSGREFRLIMSEGALRWNVGGAEVMLDQLTLLSELRHRDNVHLGVIPWTTRTGMPGAHAFHLYDTRAVIVGTLNATAIMTTSRDVAEYESWFHRFEAIASFGGEAQAVFERIAEDYRSLI
jgi:transcriptional regulator with XRE-family HTH domain